MIHYNVPGAKRKELARAIAEWLEVEAAYKGAPSFTYEIGSYTVDKDGNLIPGEDSDEETTERLAEHLYDAGFECDLSETDEEESCLALSIPQESLSLPARANLNAVLKAKGDLIKKAIGADELPVLYGQDEITFPWFKADAAPEEGHAYTEFISKLCEYARNQKRVNATAKPVENEKYAFRCFLLRLGFIGDAYKADRKILLRNLEGSSAFKTGKKEAE